MSLILNDLKRRAESSPDATAVLAPGHQSLNWAELLGRTDAIGRSLAAAGVKRHDVVAIVLPDGPGFFLAFLGAFTVAACAPLNPASTRAELELFLGELRPKAVIVETRECAAAAVANVMGILLFEAVELGQRYGAKSQSNLPSLTTQR